VGNTPAGTVAATTVQAAINELDTEKASLAALAASGGSSLVGFLQAGSGAVVRTAQSKMRDVVSVKDFGAVGDGVADDTVAWNYFVNHCASTGAQGYLPPGTYLIDPFTFDATMAGLHLVGPVYNPMHPSFGLQPAILKRRGTGGNFLTFSAGWNTSFQFIEIDGSYTSDSVIEFAGGSGANSFNQLFENCAIYGATPTAGVVLDFTGSIQGDSTTFNRCNIHGYGVYDFSQNALSLIRNVNSNAFLINFNECYFSSAIKMFDFGAGSCSFNGCQFFRAQTYFFYVRSITQPFTVNDCYTEQASGILFFTQAGTAGVTSQYPITLQNLTLNAVNPMTLNCQQNVRLLNVYTQGSITITPMVTYGTQNVYAESVSFGAGADFLGSYDSMLTAVNTINSGNARATKNAQPVTTKITALTYGASIAVDASLGNEFSINANNGAAFTIATPTNISANQVIGFRIYNTSGGALGTLTWGAGYRLAGGAWTSPANLTSRYIQFDYQGGVWYERFRSSGDVPV
jgi:hypothetical protein